MTPRERTAAATVKEMLRCVKMAVEAERQRIVDLILQRAEAAKGKTWYHPEIDLRVLVVDIQGTDT